MANQDIRSAISAAGIRYWQVANSLGISDGSFSRKLRVELTENEKQKVMEAIERARKVVC